MSAAQKAVLVRARNWCRPVLFLLLAQAIASALAQLSVQVEMPPSAPVRLVSSDRNWNYHKGTSSPTNDWRTSDDQTLGWPAAPGGFGFAPDNPNETTKCRTILNDMFNRYSTLYTRQSFWLSDAPAADQRLLLTVDFDDGFVAYLDGVEVARFNAP